MADVDMKDAPAAETVTDLSSSDVQTKYKDAAIIANAVLDLVLKELAPGKLVADICELGDKAIEDSTAKVYKSKKIDKGIAFPTCISVNECVGHYSPLKSESIALKDGDVVKVDLGVHLDGFIALVAHTTVIGAGAAAPVTGPKADVIAAAHQAAEIALRMIKPGAKNTAVTEAIEKVCAAYGVNAIVGVQSNQLRQFELDSQKAIPIKRDPSVKQVEECTFEANEVYAVDIALTTGDGKPRETEARTTVFKRNLDVTYNMKMKASRWLVAEVNRRFPALPFTLRALGDETQARLGVKEAVTHGAVGAYPVLYERNDAATAHFRFTALLLPGGTQKVTGLDLPAWVQSAKTLPEDLAAIRASVPYVKKERKPKAAAAGAGAADVEMS